MTTQADNTARKFETAESEIVHGTYWPMDLRQDSGVTASLTLSSNQETTPYQAQIWRISPLGAEFNQEGTPKQVQVGDVMEIHVNFKNQACQFHGIVVSTNLQSVNGKKLIGIRWCENDREQMPRQTRRNVRRWICSPSFLPTAVAPNPVLFNDLLLFRVVDVSKNGARLLTSMRNKFIIPNMYFDGVFTFPMIGSCHGRFKVNWTDLVSTNGKQELSLGVEFDNPTKELAKLMGEYILQFGDNATVKEIRDSGLNVRNTAKAIEISYARTENDYREVLDLRRIAYDVYKKDGEIPELSDIYDSRSRILIARHHGKCVASARIIFHDMHDNLEQEQYVKMPDNLPRKDELVEVTRICSHPDYRASDLIYELAKHTYVAMIQAKRRYLIGSSPDHLLPLYSKMGGTTIGSTYSPKSCPELRLHVMMFDLQNFLKGVNVNPLIWSFLGEDLLKLAIERDFVHLDTMAKIRLSAFRMLKPIGQRLLQAKENKPSAKDSKAKA